MRQDQPPGNKPGPQGPRISDKRPRISPWILLVANMYFLSQADPNEIEYGQFLDSVRNGYVEEVVIVDDAYVRGLYTGEAIDRGLVEPGEPPKTLFNENDAEATRRFVTVKPDDHELTKFLEDYNAAAIEQAVTPVKYGARRDENWLAGLLTWVLPLGLIVVLWLFLLKRMNPGQQVLNIGKNKAVLFDATGDQAINFDDVAGLDEPKGEVEEVVDFLKNPKRFTRLGGKLPKGVLLVGPPGTGKTLLARAVAGEAAVPFFSLSGSDFVEMFVGVGAARVRDLFRQAKEKAPCIIFIDEIDAIGRSRGKNMMMGGNDERENTLNQLLVEMDGFNTDEAVIIMAATNRPDVLDHALLRPGRFDRQILIDKPDRRERSEIFKVHTKDLILSDTVDTYGLAGQTPGFAGAEIANVCNEAALLAAREGKESVEMIDFEKAIDRVIGGLEKKNKIISPEEKEIVAFHESGHAVTGWFLKHTDPVIKVSIIPRGLAALGYAQYLPEERYLYTSDGLLDRMVMMMGGRVAEEIIFDQVSTGAQNDLERITKMAYAMVTDYGMSEKIGYISYNLSAHRDEPFFDKPYSSETAQVIDDEVQVIVKQVRARARKLLDEKDEELNAMAQALLKKEVLTASEIEQILGPRPFPTADDAETKSEPETPDTSEVIDIESNGSDTAAADASRSEV